MSFGQFDAGTDKSQFSAISFLIEQAMLKMQTVTLVKVIAVHSNNVGITGTVDVQPMVNQMAEGPNGSQTAIAHGTIYGVPFYRLQGGASAFICDPVAGDVGMCGFAARDISSVKSTRAVANPGSQRVYDWADGLYIGGFINGVPTQYIQALASDGGWKIVSPGDLTVDVPLAEFTGDLVVDGDATITGDTTLTGTTTAVGPISAAAITSSGVITAAGFSGPGGTSPAGPPGPPGPTGPTGPQGPAFLDVSDGTHSGSGITSLVFNGATVSISGTTATVTGGGGGGGISTITASSFFALTAPTGPTTNIDLSTGFQAALAVTAGLAVSALQPKTGLSGSFTNVNLTIDSNGQITAAANGSSSGAPLTTKGDLFTYSTTDARLPVGPDGSTLVADSTQPTGLKWVFAAPAGVSSGLQFWFQGDELLGGAGANIPELFNSAQGLGLFGSYQVVSGQTGATVAAADLNGLNTATFLGSNTSTYTVINSSFSPPLTANTCFFVMKIPTPGTTQVLLAGGGNAFQIGTDGTGKMAITADLLAILGTNATNLPVGTYFQQNVTWTNATLAYAFRTSQAADGSGTASVGTGGSPSTGIGWNQPASVQFLTANLAEFIIYNRVLTSAEILAIEAYLFAKWGV